MHFLTFIFFSKVLFPLLFVESQKEQIWTFLACKFEISDDTEKQLSRNWNHNVGFEKGRRHQSEEILFSIQSPTLALRKKIGVKETTPHFTRGLILLHPTMQWQK